MIKMKKNSQNHKSVKCILSTQNLQKKLVAGVHYPCDWIDQWS